MKQISPRLSSVTVAAVTFLTCTAPGYGQGAGTGLNANYFPNTGLTAPVALTRVDPTVNFEWGTGKPAASMPVADKFSARWTGKVEAPVTGAYTFLTRSDDGVRLWVNGQLLINNWRDHSPRFDQSVPLNLTAGQKYDVQLEFYENQGGATMQFYWRYPGQAEQVIPQGRLYPEAITVRPAPEAVSRVWLSDINWLSSANGWGPVELDKSNGEQAAKDGKTMSIGGKRYYEGLGVHAQSEVVYALGDRYDMFRSIIGVDDEVGNAGSVVFEVWTDGRMAYRSPVMRGDMPGLAIEVPVENVNTLRLVVTDAGDGKSMDHANWAEARFEGVERIRYLSDIGWMSATNGLGDVAKDRAAGGTATREAERIKLRGMVYRKGLGTHANAEIKYDLDKKYDRFNAIVGIDDSAGAAGSAIFEVWNGTTRIYRSATLRGGGAIEQVSLPIAGIEYLTLKVLDAGDGNTRDFADWANAFFLPVGSDDPAPTGPPPAPTNLSASAADRSITLNWAHASTATSYNIFRGTATNGQAETPVAQNVTGLTWTNNGLTNGVRYFYKIKANNPMGTSGWSNEASAVPTNGITPPAVAPTLTATPGASRVELSWTAVPNATGYRVFRGMTPNGQSTSPIAGNVTGTTFSNTGLTNGTQYFYKVQAFNGGGSGAMSNEASATPASLPAAPSGLTATPAATQITLTWMAVPGATSYRVYRGPTANNQAPTPIATNLTAATFVNTDLTNGTPYFYRVTAVNIAGEGPRSNEATAIPNALPAAPSGLTATPGVTSVSLSWTAVPGAATYRVYRGTAANGQATTPVAANLTATTFNNTGLTNGTQYFYKVTAVNSAGESPQSAEVNATPQALPAAPTGLSATVGNATVTLNWTAVTGATSYRVYRGTVTIPQSATPLATGVTSATFNDAGLTNGTNYFYRVSAVNGVGEGARSNEVTAQPIAPQPPVDPTDLSFFRLLRQTSWGPRPGQVETVRTQGRAAYLDQQLNTPPSVYPDTLYDSSQEVMQEHFMRLALTGEDQLRQRVAWALHKIWVVSGVEISRADALVVYQRVLLNGAFGNYRQLMRDMTLNPAMGRYLNMLNNRSQASSGFIPNENYARELLQLFTLGLTTLNPDGTSAGTPTYTEEDVKELARIFTGWTFGDGNPATVPNNLASENWRVPMEPVARFHDVGAKRFMGRDYLPNQTAQQDLDQALDQIFNHPNLPPFVCRQLIQMLVTSNPSPAYVSAISQVFAGNGGTRGDLRAVVRAILMHPEANLPSGNPQGKLMEPVLYVLNQARGLNAQVADHPFLTDLVEEMGQRVFFPNSVFSYFSPGFRIRGTPLTGPEYQGLTSVTALIRANFAGRLLGGNFGADVTIDYGPFTSRAGDPAALVDYCSQLFLGGQMSPEMRTEIINAVRATPATNAIERTRTALYLIFTSAQFQVER